MAGQTFGSSAAGRQPCKPTLRFLCVLGGALFAPRLDRQVTEQAISPDQKSALAAAGLRE